MHTNEYIATLPTQPCNSKPISTYYRLDTATEESFKNLEHHDTKILIFENAGIVQRQPEHIWTSDKPQKQSTEKAANAFYYVIAHYVLVTKQDLAFMRDHP